MYFRHPLPISSSVYHPLPVQRYIMMTMGGFWPVIQQLPNGHLGVVARDGDFHMGERGRLVFVTSPDGGESWSHATVIAQEGPDNRNPAFGVTRDGTLLVAFIRADRYVDGEHAPAKNRGKCTPMYISRSEDCGITWSPAELIDEQGDERWSGASDNDLTSPHKYYSPFGKMVTLADGTILLSYYINQSEEPGKSAAFLLRSHDEGRTWVDPITVHENTDETSITDIGENRLFAALRGDRLWQVTSADNGYTWSERRPLTEKMEFPGDVIRLRDGRLLLTYGRREPPYGVQGLMSYDGGISWDNEHRLLLVGDSSLHDCGYPSSVQREDGSIVTVYYAWDIVSEQYKRRRMGVHGAALIYSPEDLPWN